MICKCCRIICFMLYTVVEFFSVEKRQTKYNYMIDYKEEEGDI